MPKKPLFCRQVDAKMKRAGRCVNTGPGSNHDDLAVGDQSMADEPNIRTRGPLSTDKKMASLTRRQLDCLKFIRSFRDENGVTPTYREIIDALSLKSTSGAHRIVLALETRGHVYRRAGEARSITLVDDEGPSVSEALQIILGKCTLTTGTASELRALLGMERAG